MNKGKLDLCDLWDKVSDVELNTKKLICLIEDIKAVSNKDQLKLYMMIDYAYEIIDTIKSIEPKFSILIEQQEAE